MLFWCLSEESLCLQIVARATFTLYLFLSFTLTSPCKFVQNAVEPQLKSSLCEGFGNSSKS